MVENFNLIPRNMHVLRSVSQNCFLTCTCGGNQVSPSCSTSRSVFKTTSLLVLVAIKISVLVVLVHQDQCSKTPFLRILVEGTRCFHFIQHQIIVLKLLPYLYLWRESGVSVSSNIKISVPKRLSYMYLWREPGVSISSNIKISVLKLLPYLYLWQEPYVSIWSEIEASVPKALPYLYM